MKCLLLPVFITIASLTTALGQEKLSKDESAKMTQDQRIAYENDRQHAKHKKKKKNDSVKKKAKRAKKQDKQSRKIKQPKHKKNEY